MILSIQEEKDQTEIAKKRKSEHSLLTADYQHE